MGDTSTGGTVTQFERKGSKAYATLQTRGKGRGPHKFEDGKTELLEVLLKVRIPDEGDEDEADR